MKGTAINNLAYTGIVTLSQYSGQKKVQIAQKHNFGGPALFNLLANCFAGNFTATDALRPKKVKLVYRNPISDDPDDGYEYTEAFSGFVHLSTTPEVNVTSNQCSIKYPFSIPREILDNVTDYSNLCLGLYAKDAADEDVLDFVAICWLGDISAAKLISATLVVDWELVFANANE